MTSLLVVVGINGRQGTAVARQFYNLEGWKVRGLTSSPQGQMSDRWRAHGVEIVEVDLNKVDSVRAAVDGATAIFLVTDYYKQLTDHSVLTFTDLSSTPLEMNASVRDVEAGRKVLDAAAALPNLNRIIMSTIRTRSDNLRGKWYITAKVELLDWLKDVRPELWEKTSLIQPCLAMEDFLLLLKKKDDGTLEYVGTAPWHSGYPWICLTKDFGRMVRALLCYTPNTHNLAAFSQFWSGAEIANCIQELSGKQCTYRQLTAAEIPSLNYWHMVDLILCNAPYEYYEVATVAPQQFANSIQLLLPLTQFKDWIAARLPAHLEMLAAQEEETVNRGPGEGSSA